ncbi:MAG: hypothetical protein AAGA57_02585 [Planctomycetota bacterium]
MPIWSLSSLRKRSESTSVPEPITREGSKPDSSMASRVSASTGLLTTTMTAFGAITASVGMRSAKSLALASAR